MSTCKKKLNHAIEQTEQRISGSFAEVFGPVSYPAKLGLKSKCKVCCISSAQIGDNEIRDIKPRYYIGIHVNFAIFPILSENDEA